MSFVERFIIQCSYFGGSTVNLVVLVGEVSSP